MSEARQLSRRREKRTTRPRGFAEWSPRAESLELLDNVRAVLAAYRQYLPVSIRQIFYRLVATTGLDKTERSYGNLADMLVRARRAGLISWDDIRDDGYQRSRFTAWDDPADWTRAVLASARQYRRDRQIGQPRRLVLWCEAAGMVPQLERVATPFSVPVVSSGGFDSVTAKHQLAREFVAAGRTTVLHLGDFDPSGLHMFSSLDEDVRAFVDALSDPDSVRFERLAVTPDQIDELGLPRSPVKKTDRRSFAGAGTVQAEAIPPDRLARIVEDAISDRIDREIFADVLSSEQEERDGLVRRVSSILEDVA